MKRLLAVVLMLALLLCGCARGTGAPVVGSYKYNYYISGGAEGESCHALAKAFAGHENKFFADMNMLLRTNGDDKANIAAISDGTLDFAAVRSDALAGQEAGNVSAVLSVYNENIQLIALSSAKIKDAAALSGKKVAIGLAGSTDETLCKKILAAAGIADGAYEAVNMAEADAIGKLAAGEVDAAFVIGDDNRAAIEGAIGTLAFLPLGEEAIAALMEEGCFTRVNMPVGEYKGFETAYDTIAARAVIIAGSSLPEDAVYGAIKALFDNKDAFVQGFAAAAGLDAGAGVQGVKLPLHPGAEKYFGEKQISGR